MLVSPAEPAFLRALGTVSGRCEERGVDFLFPAYQLGPVGVQRKEISDLLASVYDGRLSREIAQMSVLQYKVLLIEGRLQWTQDGFLVSTNRPWTRAQHDGLLWSCQLHGLWTAFTSDIDDTKAWLGRFGKWLLKKTHNGVLTRVGPKPGQWATRESKEWGVHLLQGVEGIGYERAERIWEFFGQVPMAWTVGADDLEQVDGIGPKLSRKFIDALGTTHDAG